MAPFLQRLQRLDGIQLRFPANSFIDQMLFLGAVFQGHRHRNDFILEAARFGRRRPTFVRVVGELVQLRLAYPVFLRHALSTMELAERFARIALADFTGKRVTHFLDCHHRRTDGHLAHGFHPAGNHQVLGATHHRLGGKVDCLLGGAALTVNGDARYGLRQAGAHDRGPRHVEGLRADLAHTTKNHVVDFFRRHPGALDHCINNAAAHICRVYLAQPTVLLATSGTHRRYDICFCHRALLIITVC